MTAALSIGDFSRASHLTIKTLRHYHDIGVLVPADIDASTGYRRYATDQLSDAQVIRRLRALDMPLDQIRAVLTAPDVQARNEQLAAHLARLESDLERTASAVRSLADLLTPDPGQVAEKIELRRTPAVDAAVIHEVVAAEDAVAWLQGALGELHATLSAQRLDVAGPPGGIYDDAVFTQHRGQATIFIPCSGVVRPIGRVVGDRIPAGEFAVLTHRGGPAEVDRTYAALATYVARHALAVQGPIREYYLVGAQDTPNSTRWRTEIAWPVFLTAAFS